MTRRTLIASILGAFVAPVVALVAKTQKPMYNAIHSRKDLWGAQRIDAASLSIIPPIGYPNGRPPARLGPGCRIPKCRQGDFNYIAQ